MFEFQPEMIREARLPRADGDIPSPAATDGGSAEGEGGREGGREGEGGRTA